MTTKGKCPSRRLRPRYQFMKELMQKEGRSWRNLRRSSFGKTEMDREALLLDHPQKRRKIEWRYGRNGGREK
jgi:hypothetical protein